VVRLNGGRRDNIGGGQCSDDHEGAWSSNLGIVVYVLLIYFFSAIDCVLFSFL
jgi:hypothetical protein